MYRLVPNFSVWNQTIDTFNDWGWKHNKEALCSDRSVVHDLLLAISAPSQFLGYV